MGINDFNLTAIQMHKNSLEIVSQSKKVLFLNLFEKAITEKILNSLTKGIQKESDRGKFKARVTEHYDKLLTSIENDKEFDSSFKKFLIECNSELDDLMFDRFVEVCERIHGRLFINGFKVNKKLVDSRGFRSVTFSVDWSFERKEDSVIVDCVELDYDYINGK